MPISTTPTKATAVPITTHLGSPSRRKSPAPRVIRRGPIFTIIAVVPASRDCSAMLSSTL
jgi:hypothetical protein